MIAGKRVISVIHAYSSTGLRKQFTRTLLDRTLLEWSILNAGSSNLTDCLITATSDEDAAAEAKRLGKPVLSVANDSSSVIEAVLQLKDFEMVAVIDAACPLTLGSDIDSCLELAARDGFPVVSVSETGLESNELFYLASDRGMNPAFSSERHQGGRKLYRSNRAIMVASRDFLIAEKSFAAARSRAFIMPQERSQRVESKLSLATAESILRRTLSEFPGISQASSPTPMP